MSVTSTRSRSTATTSALGRLRVAFGQSRDVPEWLCRVSAPLLRVSLGVVFVWFGLLKIAHATPIADLVAATLPFLPANLVVPALGGFEVVLGVALLVGRGLRIACLLLVAHLAGTMLVLVMAPTLAFQHGNPLLLTMTGEFVVKNLVLIAAGIMLLSCQRVVSAAQTTCDSCNESAAAG